MVVQRRCGHDTSVETLARSGLAAAEAAGMLDYLGASQAGLAWVAWRRGNLAEARAQALTALEAWRRSATPYPFYWQALWPLIGVALAQARPTDAIAHARCLHEPGQQLLPAELAALTTAALHAWDAGQADSACDHLCRALNLAQQSNFS